MPKEELMQSMEGKTESKTRLFEQQPRESNKAFAAFSLYLNMGPQRSLDAVARQLAKSLPLIKRWSARWDWAERVAAHAAHLAIVEREALEAVARGKAAQWEQREQQLRETEWSMHERAIAAAKRGLEAYMKRQEVYANLADIARMLEIASKLGRLATGLGTDGERGKGDELPAVRVEVTLALEKIYGEALPVEVSAPPAIVDVEEVPVGGNSQSLIANSRASIADGQGGAR
jgi:hypothetical protein